MHDRANNETSHGRTHKNRCTQSLILSLGVTMRAAAATSSRVNKSMLLPPLMDGHHHQKRDGQRRAATAENRDALAGSSPARAPRHGSSRGKGQGLPPENGTSKPPPKPGPAGFVCLGMDRHRSTLLMRRRRRSCAEKKGRKKRTTRCPDQR